jgi:hypothetical protein
MDCKIDFYFQMKGWVFWNLIIEKKFLQISIKFNQI